MRNLFAKWLSALLIAALLLTPVAMMEEEITDEAPLAEVQEETDDAPTEAEAEEVPEIGVEAVDETVDALSVPLNDDEWELGVETEADTAAYGDMPLFAADGSAVTAPIPINEENFPDKGFREFVETFIDDPTNEEGIGVLSAEELSISGIMVEGKHPSFGPYSFCEDVKALDNIHLFPNLESLICRDLPNLETINLSEMSQVSSVMLYNCSLRALNLTDCTKLETLELNNVHAEQLDIHLSECTNLQFVFLTGCEIETLNIYSPGYNGETGFGISFFSGTTVKDMNILYASDLTNKVTFDQLNVTGTLNLEGLICLPKLEINNSKIDVLDFAKDSSMEKLEQLNLNGCTIGEVNARQLDSLARVEIKKDTFYYPDDENGGSIEVTPPSKVGKLDLFGCNSLYQVNVYDTEVGTMDVTGSALHFTDIGEGSSIREFIATGCENYMGFSADNCVFDTLTVVIDDLLETYVSLKKCEIITLNFKTNCNTAGLDLTETPLDTLNFTGSTTQSLAFWSPCEIGNVNIATAYSVEFELSLQEAVLDALTVNGGDTLNHLSVSGSKSIGMLDMSASPQLLSLYCPGCEIDALNVSKNTELRELNCNNNNLRALDVSGCAELRELKCYNNRLTDLNVSKNPKLEMLSCASNQIKTLDVSCCVHILKYLDAAHCTQSDDGATAYWDEDDNPVLVCDTGVNIVNAKSAGSSASTTSSAPAAATTTVAAPAAPAAPAPEPAPVIPAISKSSKTTLSAAPGTVAQLELGGAPGKKFKSSNKKVATVNSAGVVTIKKAGKTKITFKVGKKTRKVTLTVKDPTIPSFIALNLAGTVPAQVGVPQALSVTLPENTTSGIKWKSSNKKVATVNSNGIVTFKKAGKVTITATATRGKKKAKVKFVVTK